MVDATGRDVLVTEKRNYTVTVGSQAKAIAGAFLDRHGIEAKLGLAEPNDRYHEWKVPALSRGGEWLGNLFVDAYSGGVNPERSTDPAIMGRRLQDIGPEADAPKRAKKRDRYPVSDLTNRMLVGDSVEEMDRLPEGSVDLVFTSPPYYNARPQYKEYQSYEAYLGFIRRVIASAARVLVGGRYFVINISHVLVPRSNRNESSKRLAVPFDFHHLFIEAGFEFVDDIIWQKPAGAGWASGRGRRFAADRNPLQYKAVPVTEYVLVYRKTSDRLIDWFIRNHPDRGLVRDSKIVGEYDQTNVWYITPSHNKSHPATFPVALAEKVIRYYSFKNDVVLDPFVGIGTTATAALNLGRRVVGIDQKPEYVAGFFRANGPLWAAALGPSGVPQTDPTTASPDAGDMG